MSNVIINKWTKRYTDLANDRVCEIADIFASLLVEEKTQCISLLIKSVVDSRGLFNGPYFDILKEKLVSANTNRLEKTGKKAFNEAKASIDRFINALLSMIGSLIGTEIKRDLAPKKFDIDVDAIPIVDYCLRMVITEALLTEDTASIINALKLDRSELVKDAKLIFRNNNLEMPEMFSRVLNKVTEMI